MSLSITRSAKCLKGLIEHLNEVEYQGGILNKEGESSPGEFWTLENRFKAHSKVANDSELNESFERTFSRIKDTRQSRWQNVDRVVKELMAIDQQGEVPTKEKLANLAAAFNENITFISYCPQKEFLAAYHNVYWSLKAKRTLAKITCWLENSSVAFSAQDLQRKEQHFASKVSQIGEQEKIAKLKQHFVELKAKLQQRLKEQEARCALEELIVNLKKELSLEKPSRFNWQEHIGIERKIDDLPSETEKINFKFQIDELRCKLKERDAVDAIKRSLVEMKMQLSNGSLDEADRVLRKGNWTFRQSIQLITTSEKRQELRTEFEAIADELKKIINKEALSRITLHMYQFNEWFNSHEIKYSDDELHKAKKEVIRLLDMFCVPQDEMVAIEAQFLKIVKKLQRRKDEANSILEISKMFETWTSWSIQEVPAWILFFPNFNSENFDLILKQKFERELKNLSDKQLRIAYREIYEDHIKTLKSQVANYLKSL